jgi:hypothetical protein
VKQFPFREKFTHHYCSIILQSTSPGITFATASAKRLFMKKFILLVAVSWSVFSIQSCDSNDNKKDKKKNDEISASSVPEPVKSAFSSKYETASDIKWEDAQEDGLQTYKAKFTRNGKKMKAEFDGVGKLIKESEDN